MNEYPKYENCSAEVQRQNNVFKRTSYFHGMLLNEDDFLCEQSYNIEKRRLANQMLHGWGVIRGLDIQAAQPSDNTLTIHPGLVIDCKGNEIQIKEKITVTVTKDDFDRAELYSYHSQASEKAILQKLSGDENQYKYYIAVKWVEGFSGKRASFAPPSEEDEQQPCGYSRIDEGFCIEIFKTPASDDIPVESKITEMITECQDNKNKLECLNDALKEYQIPLDRQPFPNPSYAANNNLYVVLGTITLKSEESQTLVIEPEMISVIEGRIHAYSSPFWRHFYGAFFNPIVEHNNATDERLNDVNEKLKGIIEDIKKLQETHVDHKHKSKYIDWALPISVITIILLIWHCINYWPLNNLI